MTDDERIAERAAWWVEQINRPAVDSAKSADFDAWMEADARHADAFVRLQALWDSDTFETALGDPRLLDDRAGKAAQRPTAAAARGGRSLWFTGVAAALAIAAAGLSLVLSPGAVRSLETGKGAGAAIVLADGSRLELSPNSQIRASIRPWRRSVALLRGEAYFDVRHEAWRPFVVESGADEVKVLGTAFDVDRRGDAETVVTVFRGRVGLGPRDGELRPIAAGHAGRLVGDSLTVSALEAAQQAPDWKSGWFDAQGVGLPVLIERLNRYSTRPIVIGRADLQRRTVTGRFHVREPADVLQALEAAYDVRPQETSDRIVLW